MLKFRRFSRYFAAVLCAEGFSQSSEVQVTPCGSELLSYVRMGLQGGHRITLLEMYSQCNSYERCVERSLPEYPNILGPSKTSCIKWHFGFVGTARSWRIVLAREQRTLPTAVMNPTNIYIYIYIYTYIHTYICICICRLYIIRHIQIHNCKPFRVRKSYILSIRTFRRYCIISIAAVSSVVVWRKMEWEQ